MRRVLPLLSLGLIAACGHSPDAEDWELGMAEALTPSQPERSASASLWNQHPESLFGNRRAREVGDLLTVVVAIDDQAEILNDVQRNRQSERLLSVPAAFGLPQWAEQALPGDANLNPALDVQSQERLRGQGNLRRQDRITLRLAARVRDRLPNGDLVIEGSQSVQVGRDRRYLKVNGVVRPIDITRQNTVPHDRIANADIRYVPKGPLDDTGRKPWGDSVLDKILPF